MLHAIAVLVVAACTPGEVTTALDDARFGDAKICLETLKSPPYAVVLRYAQLAPDADDLVPQLAQSRSPAEEAALLRVVAPRDPEKRMLPLRAQALVPTPEGLEQVRAISPEKVACDEVKKQCEPPRTLWEETKLLSTRGWNGLLVQHYSQYQDWAHGARTVDTYVVIRPEGATGSVLAIFDVDSKCTGRCAGLRWHFAWRIDPGALVVGRVSFPAALLQSVGVPTQ